MKDLEKEVSKKELDKFIAEKEWELAELELKIQTTKSKAPVNIGELLGLMNKKDLTARSLTQVSDLKKELYA